MKKETAIIHSEGHGSLRNIEIKRNGETVGNFDFYDLLINGNTKNEGLFSEIGCLGELIIKNKNKKLTITYGEII